jgi:arylsulfatase A-like enzyme/Tfp pilus assembly protein PilF
MKLKKVHGLAAAGLVVAAGAAVYFLAVAREPGFARLTAGRAFNVVLVTLDTVRADAVGCYGRRDVRTPTLDAWAADGVRFENCFAQTPLTLTSHVTLMTGTQPLFHGVRDNGAFVVPPKMVTMAELFKAKGYATGAFIAAYVLDSQWGLDQGFDLYYDKFDLKKFPRMSLEAVQRPANEVLDAALPWLEARKGGPFFAWVHLYDAHAPYDPPAPYDKEYAALPYLGEIAFVDAQLLRLRRFLESNGLADHTIVVLAGDHGESLGEHGEATHGFFVYQSALRVPLIIATPFPRFRGIVSSEAAGLVDVLPTVCRMAGLAIPDEVQGRSLLGAFFGRPDRRPPLVYSETYYPRFHFGWSELKAVQNARYKLILAPRPELYDLTADPREERNLAAAEPQVFRKLSGEAETFMRQASRNAYELDTSRVDAKARERLSALGYVGSFTDQTRLEGKALADPKDKITVYNELAVAREMAKDGRPGEAVDVVRRIVATDPDIPDAYFTLGSLLAQDEKLTEAIEAFKQLLERKPDEAFAALNVTRLYERMGRLDEAERFAEEYLRRGFEEPQMLLMLGDLKLRRKDYDGAVPYFERSLTLDADLPEACEALATIGIAKGDLAGAADYLRKAQALDPRLGNIHYRLGWIAERQGRPDEAEAEYLKEIEISPRHFQALYNLARIYDSSGRLDQERQMLERGLEADPKFPLTYLYLARLDLAQDRSLPEAVGLVEKGLALAPEPAETVRAYFLLSELYRRLGDAARSRDYAAKGRALAAETGRK